MRKPFLLLLFSIFAAVAAAHPANVPVATAKVQADGSYQLRIKFDVLAYVLEAAPYEIADGPMNALLDGPQSELASRLADSKERFRRQLKVVGNGEENPLGTYTFPTASEVLAMAASNKPRLPVMLSATVFGKLKAGAKTVSFRFPEALGTVVLTTELPYQEPVSEPVDPGSESSPLNIPTAEQVAAAAKSMTAPRTIEPPKPARAAPVPPVVGSGNAPWEIAAEEMRGLQREIDSLQEMLPQMGPVQGPPPAPTEKPVLRAVPAAELVPPIKSQALSPWAAFPRYVKMGLLHIVPEGLDHILFVLGLFLLSTRMKDLLKQITAFTIAHSLTLALSLYGVVRLPSSVVEPIIALSIAFVAIENLVTKEMKAWRPLVVFAFGLVHGLGFAGALQDAGLQHGNFLTALVGFNIGVELGQLSVVAGAFLLLGWFRSNLRYRQLVTVPASFVIAAVALFWTVERLR